MYSKNWKTIPSIEARRSVKARIKVIRKDNIKMESKAKALLGELIEMEPDIESGKGNRKVSHRLEEIELLTELLYEARKANELELTNLGKAFPELVYKQQ